ncbi:MAG: hypothetical protein ACK5MQ_05245 [Pikeienuella sp.]
MQFSGRRYARMLIALGGAISLAACSLFDDREPSGPTPFDKTVVDDCYTVDLFDVAKVETPEAGVPAAWAAYSGKWGSAAWEGKWCHDLYVLRIASSGEVDVMDLHAPYEPWGKPATAFRRKGRIAKDGRLRIVKGSVVSEYWLENGRLYGLRREGAGEMRIALQPRVNSRIGKHL